ncbi:hypothetical protein [Halodesulfovibrio sp.]|jgi:prophage antirepressor-like protein|uniref:hypothetical protein n=1 Tax=Halodesulfovibrio sp. TaxID=1912772 RepID=UPI0025DCA058|nr:hypothetical protein [Halodesulfovibrio sp.]MCT4628025.1 hypothetical protein [Halodesulfovibrio sp.]
MKNISTTTSMPNSTPVAFIPFVIDNDSEWNTRYFYQNENYYFSLSDICRAIGANFSHTKNLLTEEELCSYTSSIEQDKKILKIM